jgi:hypothetical protein
MATAQCTLGVRGVYGVRMLRDGLLGLRLFLGTTGLGLLGLSTVHTTVGTPRQSTITARRTLPCNTLAGILTTGGLQLLELEAEGGNFSNEGVHGGEFLGFRGGGGDLGRITTQK